jgi:uncharacterized protein (DUF427 family)
MTARGRVRVEPCPKRIRGHLAGHLVCDTVHAWYVWERPVYPWHHVPIGDVVADLRPTGEVRRSPSRGDADVHDVLVGGHVAERTALVLAKSPFPELAGTVRFDWAGPLTWLEEDEPVHTHPRDPGTRIDVLASSRTVRIELDGVVLAESSAPLILFETRLPPRYYLPVPHVRTDLLVPSATATACPYKGHAVHWSARTPSGRRDDVAWTYPSASPEVAPIAGRICFYDERVDVWVDGGRSERPRTPFS